jgi:hypothetical protein
MALVADCQYCDKPHNNTRHYRLSPQKLQDCVAHINTVNPQGAIHLGDFIDRDWDSFDVVEKIWAQLRVPSYHVLGNHEFSVADDKKALVCKRLNMPAPYYEFTHMGWRFVVVDGNDISFHRYPKNSDEYKAVEKYYAGLEKKPPNSNGAVGTEQLAWIETILKRSDATKEPVIMLCHFPIYPPNNHNLWNDDEVRLLLERHACVKAWINGHNHKGNYAEMQGIHYLTMHGMVEQQDTAYGFLRLSATTLTCEGIGRQPTITMTLAR